MSFQEYADREMLALGLANQLASDLTTALEHEGRVLFVVPGGTTPGPIFDDLCAVDLDWSRVDVTLSDERWLPEVHVRSNTRLIQERLLTNRAARAQFLPLYAPSQTPKQAAPELATRISPGLPIAVLLLGMGEDMHTASLFPGADQLTAALDRHAPVLLPITAPGTTEPRISFSAPVLNGALAKHIVFTGQAKRAAFDRARNLPPEQAPVRAVMNGACVHWAL